jgi:SET domain-containing protein
MTAASRLVFDPDDSVFTAVSNIHGLGVFPRAIIPAWRFIPFNVEHSPLQSCTPQALNNLDHVICPFHTDCIAFLFPDFGCAINHHDTPNGSLVHLFEIESFAFEPSVSILPGTEFTINYGNAFITPGFTPA